MWFDRLCVPCVYYYYFCLFLLFAFVVGVVVSSSSAPWTTPVLRADHTLNPIVESFPAQGMHKRVYEYADSGVGESQSLSQKSFGDPARNLTSPASPEYSPQYANMSLALERNRTLICICHQGL